jgi:hypothetical protein
MIPQPKYDVLPFVSKVALEDDLEANNDLETMTTLFGLYFDYVDVFGLQWLLHFGVQPA